MARLIDADKLPYEDIESIDGNTYMCVNAYDIEHAPTIEQSDDCISREALIEKATSWDKHFADSERYVSLTDIQGAPPVTPQPKRGKWIRVNGDYVCTLWKCNQCGNEIYSETEYDRKKFHAWCGKCGCRMDADMREVQDDGI